MSNIFALIVVWIMALAGIAITLFFTLGIFAVIIWKIYRKVKYGYSLYQ